LSNIIIPSEETQLQDGLAEIIGETPAPNLLGIAEEYNLLANSAAPYKERWIDEALLRIGGTNKFGEPNFIAVWGQSATEHGWGQQRIKYPAARVNDEELLGYDVHNPGGPTNFIKSHKAVTKLRPGSYIVPRYKKRQIEVGMPFWIIERWHDITEVFQPRGFFHKSLEEAWEKEIRWDRDEDGTLVDNEGPFPSRGVYKHFFTVKTPDFKYRPISHDVLEIIEMTLELESQVASGREYIIALREMLEKRKEKEREPIKQLQEKIEDAFNTPRLLGNASVRVPELWQGDKN
jgi:hypothetical protein